MKLVSVLLSVGIAVFCIDGAFSSGLPVLPVAAPLGKIVPGAEFDPHPQYSYGYDVSDALTGDSKSQHETRNGDVVSGSYSLIEADGTRRVVEYTADPINGFNAVVHREPAAVIKPVVAKVAPVAPIGPIGPVAPAAAFAPIGSVAHFGSVAPIGPIGPVGPVGPTGPVAPFVYHP